MPYSALQGIFTKRGAENETRTRSKQKPSMSMSYSRKVASQKRALTQIAHILSKYTA